MWTQLTTKIVVGILFTSLIISDVLLYVLVGNEATWSKAMQSLGRDWPIVVVASGLVVGHFYVPREESFTDVWSELKPYVLLALGVFISRIAWSQGLSMSK